MAIYFGNGSGNLAADRRYEMARSLAGGGDFAAAADLLVQALELAPDWPPLHFELGEALRRNSRTEEAMVAFKAYLSRDPQDRMGAAIKLALMEGNSAPAHLPAEYVRSLFDQYAPKFDHALVETLQYRTPLQIHDAVCAIGRENFTSLLDLGCGTGLAAELFLGSAKRLIGIDLSPAMIDIARNKNIYDELHVDEIGSFLKYCTEKFDLVLSADVFVYVGALEKIFEHIAKCMMPEGVFAFSVQTTKEQNWILGTDHRYAHSRGYIEYCAAQAGLDVISATNAVLRTDGGKPIHGFVFVCLKN